jgi:hypothetical protein
MSLTSVVVDDAHPVSRWMAARLPGTSAVRRGYRGAVPVRRVQRPVVGGHVIVRWDLLGTAVDFRLKCAFAQPQVPPTALRGVDLTSGAYGTWVHGLGLGLARAYLEHVRRFEPHARDRPLALVGPQEDRLSRLCFALAWFERIGRDGPGEPPWWDSVAPDADVESLLAAVPAYVTRDLLVQVRLAERALSTLRESSSPRGCVAAPTFAGSGDVGGADADLVVDGRLVEVKSLTRPGSLSERTIRQLAGYVLLDYDDVYALREVCLYQARIGWLVSWSVSEFFSLLGARDSLARLRSEFAEILRPRDGGGGAGLAPGSEGPSSESSSGRQREEGIR